MEKNKSWKLSIFIILFLIIILLIIMYFCNYGKIDVLVPTGNIDIFEIILDKECNDENCDDPVFKGDNDNGLQVYDETGYFTSQKELNIFSNPAFEMKSIIAPGSSNAYQFVIRNDNDFDIQYNIKMVETNPHNVNMKYRLKQEGKYIIGNADTWVSADELNLYSVKLASKDNIPYLLEWKWFESGRDTKIGKIDNANYKLSIHVVATQV